MRFLLLKHLKRLSSWTPSTIHSLPSLHPYVHPLSSISEISDTKADTKTEAETDLKGKSEGSWKEADHPLVITRGSGDAIEWNAESLPKLLLKERDSRHPDVSLVMLLVDAVKKHDHFDHIDTATAVHSLSFIIRRPVFSIHQKSEMQQVALQLTEKLCDQLLGVSDRVLANVVYGLGILFKGVTLSLQPRLERCLTALSEEIIQEHQLVAFSQQGLSNIIYACGCLNWKPQWMLIQLSREIINRVVGFRSQEIANIICSISKLGFHHAELILTLGIEAANPKRVATFSQQELCNVLYGLVVMLPHLEDMPMKPIFGRLMFEAGHSLRMKRYNHQDVATLIYCIAALHQGNAVTSFAKTLLPQLLTKFGEMLKGQAALDRQLSMVLYSCAKMNYRDDAFLKIVDACIIERTNELDNLWSITLLLWALTSLNTLSPSAFLSLCRRICALRSQGHDMSDPNWVQLTQAIQYMHQMPEEVQLEPQIKDLLEEAMGSSKTVTSPFELPRDASQLPTSPLQWPSDPGSHRNMHTIRDTALTHPINVKRS